MNRPIKFRGRVTANFEHEMHRGKFICGALRDLGENYKKRESWSSRYWIYPGGKNGSYPVDEDSIAQLVGFDANGNEVYEGDEVIDEYGNFTIAELQDNLIQPVQLKEATK